MSTTLVSYPSVAVTISAFTVTFIVNRAPYFMLGVVKDHEVIKTQTTTFWNYTLPA